MPPPTPTSLYTTPNLVFASGIITWIIFIIALVFMKHEKYRESYTQAQIVEEQKAQIKFLENKIRQLSDTNKK